MRVYTSKEKVSIGQHSKHCHMELFCTAGCYKYKRLKCKQIYKEMWRIAYKIPFSYLEHREPNLNVSGSNLFGARFSCPQNLAKNPKSRHSVSHLM